MRLKDQKAIEVFNTYSFNSYDKIPIENTFLAFLIHYINQEEKITFAGLFGSYGRGDKRPKKESDVDIAIITKNYSPRDVPKINFKIERKIEKKIDFSYEIDMCSLNNKVDHTNDKLGIKNESFRSMVRDQIIVIKGNKDMLTD
jgi:predicted nucleotidyltransferase